jgi:uncharacterized protein YbaR (Trm112 family)
MHELLLELLVCPVCHGNLEWDIVEHARGRIERGIARCAECPGEYPIQDGIGMFLTPDLQREDLWEQVDSALIQHLKEHPELESLLMDTPLEDVAPADRFFRALVLEERGDFEEAKRVEKLANEGIYTADYQRCALSQTDYVVAKLSGSEGLIVDLASGRGYLVEQMARFLDRPIVATDFSPRVLRRNRSHLESQGVYERVSLLAFDARRTPFRAGSVETLTTNLGLQNIEHPDELLSELRRIAAGPFLAISYFVPEDDEANLDMLKKYGLDQLQIRSSALEQFDRAGWQLEIANLCSGIAKPTPSGEILEGAGIDGFPVSETTLDWCVLIAN